jgi:hypothetical protein
VEHLPASGLKIAVTLIPVSDLLFRAFVVVVAIELDGYVGKLRADVRAVDARMVA